MSELVAYQMHVLIVSYVMQGMNSTALEEKVSIHTMIKKDIPILEGIQMKKHMEGILDQMYFMSIL
jgi:hypothetical protein